MCQSVLQLEVLLDTPDRSQKTCASEQTYRIRAYCNKSDISRPFIFTLSNNNNNNNVAERTAQARARTRLPCPQSSAAYGLKATMSASRITVEWSYGRICALCRALNLKDNMKLFKSPIGVYYMVATLLRNCVSCIEGSNAITDHSGFCTPSLDNYLSSLAS